MFLSPLGVAVMPDPNDMNVAAIQDPRVLCLATMLDPRDLGMRVMPHPIDLGLEAMVWTHAWVWHQKTKKKKLCIYGYLCIFTLFFNIIFYNHEGHSCLLGSDNNVKLSLHVRPKALRSGVVLLKIKKILY